MGKNKQKLQSVVKQTNIPPSSAFTTVLFYCLLIIFLPISSFFTAKYLLFDSVLELTPIQSNIAAAIIAVVTLHIALALYLYRAYFEVADTRPTKQD